MRDERFPAEELGVDARVAHGAGGDVPHRRAIRSVSLHAASRSARVVTRDALLRLQSRVIVVDLRPTTVGRVFLEILPSGFIHGVTRHVGVKHGDAVSLGQVQIASAVYVLATEEVDSIAFVAVIHVVPQDAESAVGARGVVHAVDPFLLHGVREREEARERRERHRERARERAASRRRNIASTRHRERIGFGLVLANATRPPADRAASLRGVRVSARSRPRAKKIATARENSTDARGA